MDLPSLVLLFYYYLHGQYSFIFKHILTYSVVFHSLLHFCYNWDHFPFEEIPVVLILSVGLLQTPPLVDFL